MTRTIGARIDGRRARGERKREAIIVAALRVIERDGVSGATHRTVAGEAGVPASSVAYYFATLDDLLVAALTVASDSYIAQLRRVMDADGDDLATLAQLIAEAAGPDRRRALAERELTLLAARRPALRPMALRWRQTLTEIARRHTDDPVAVEAFPSVSDGLCARVLLGGDTPTVGEIEAVLRHTLGVRR
ncbi:TetR/AcrR family transcriptional regulator [Nocardiopsis sp. TNDT3]|uniref:TetR/AcrR family transcriptional regulator n=1 Tax=Nocardiopsis sp. TNDT3 TaxID=2249354 RepID=UPI000E3C4F44|nr:TetR family transcriptional regulator [Nocardiopsis sp. TNDT3]